MPFNQKGLLEALFILWYVGVVFVGVAQLVEHRTHKPGVVGSSPTLDTRRVRRDLLDQSLSLVQ